VRTCRAPFRVSIASPAGRRFRDDLDAFGHASHLVEVLNRLTEDREENGAVFDLLAQSLRLLADGVEPFHVTRHYELALLSLLGFQPELYRCVECREPLSPAPHQFAVSAGGFLCPMCRGRDTSARTVSVEAQKYLRVLARNGLSAAVRLRIDPPLRAELEGLLGAYLRHVAERDLGSLRILRELQDVPYDTNR
jgi:DNA repair protein RecO (recombination protein O)